MGYLGVLVAAVAAYAFGAVWYMVLAKPWVRAAGIETDENGKPAGGSNPVPYVVAFGSAVLVAGMMRHIFAMAGIETVGESLVAGLGIGLFFITPWVAMNYAYAQRPFKLTILDGGYSILGSAVIGLVLGLF